jgi:hypothetical protein
MTNPNHEVILSTPADSSKSITRWMLEEVEAQLP